MFFIHFLERVLTLHPSFFGPQVKEYLINRLTEDVEGTCTGDYYIVCVMDTFNISEGRVIPGSGVAEYTIVYRAIVWKPFKGETVGSAHLAIAMLLDADTIQGGRHCDFGQEPGNLC